MGATCSRGGGGLNDRQYDEVVCLQGMVFNVEEDLPFFASN